MEMSSFIDLLGELVKVVKINNEKLDILQTTVEKLGQNFNEVKASSDYSITKLREVEAGIELLDMPAYCEAIVELSKSVNTALGSHQNSERDENMHGDNKPQSPHVPDLNLTIRKPVQQHDNVSVDQTSVTPHLQETGKGVLVVTDMPMSKDHLRYLDQQLRLGSVSLLEVDSPWSRDGFEELKWQLRSAIPSTCVAVIFNFSTMDISDYSFEIIEQFVLFAKGLGEANNVKVIISALPPRYMGYWGDRQYSEHHEVNSSLMHLMSKHQVDSARVSLAVQNKLSCPTGRLRETRFTEWGALSYQGTFLYLKNVAAALRPPTTPRGRIDSWGSEGRGNQGLKDKKLIKALKNIIMQNDW